MTLGSQNRSLLQGAVFVRDGLIAEVGTTEELLAAHPGAPAEDLGGRLLLPGFINAHTHLYGAFARGMALKSEAPSNFLEILERLWWRLDKALTREDVYYSAMVGMMDSLKAGTTTLIDHHASPFACEGSLEAIAVAARTLGIRVSTCYEVSDRDGPDRMAQGIAENVRFLRAAKAAGDPLVAAAFGLHASLTLSDGTLDRCVEAGAAEGAVFHIHVAEDKADVVDSRRKSGLPVLARLEAAGLLAQPTIAAHCVHLEPEEQDLLTERNVLVIHNPESNMNNAVGRADVSAMLARGVTVALGTDGFTPDMRLELRAAPLLQKSATGDPRALSYDDMYRMLFVNNATVASRFFPAPLGVIASGAAADLVALEYWTPTPLSEENFLGHALFGLAGARVDKVWVGGRKVVEGGHLTGVEERAVAARARELAGRLWERW